MPQFSRDTCSFQPSSRPSAGRPARIGTNLLGYVFPPGRFHHEREAKNVLPLHPRSQPVWETWRNSSSVRDGAWKSFPPSPSILVSRADQGAALAHARYAQHAIPYSHSHPHSHSRLRMRCANQRRWPTTTSLLYRGRGPSPSVTPRRQPWCTRPASPFRQLTECSGHLRRLDACMPANHRDEGHVLNSGRRLAGRRISTWTNRAFQRLARQSQTRDNPVPPEKFTR